MSAVLWLGVFGVVEAQEFRKPDEVKKIVVESTYPVKLAVEMSREDELYVWVAYHPVYKTSPEEGYHYAGFTADKLQVYKDGRLLRETAVLKDIPEPRSIESAGIGFYLVLDPRGGEEGVTTITLSSTAGKVLPDLGFAKDEFVLGPFPYQVNMLRSKVNAAKGLVYVKANCGNIYEEAKTRRPVDPFYVLFTLNKELKLIDSFIFDKGKEQDKYEQYTSGGLVFLTDTGNLYQIDQDHAGKKIKITVNRWRLKEK